VAQQISRPHRISGKTTHLGYYNTAREAALCYDYVAVRVCKRVSFQRLVRVVGEGRAVTGDDVKTFEAASHMCHRMALKDKSELADLDIPNARLECQAFTRDGGGVNIHIWMNDHEVRKGIEEP
jgi:hypothetical protein